MEDMKVHSAEPPYPGLSVYFPTLNLGRCPWLRLASSDPPMAELRREQGGVQGGRVCGNGSRVPRGTQRSPGSGLGVPGPWSVSSAAEMKGDRGEFWRPQLASQGPMSTDLKGKPGLEETAAPFSA